MSVFDRVEGHAYTVCVFEGRGVAFKVRAVSSWMLAEHSQAGLIAAMGKRSDPTADRKQAAAEAASVQLQTLIASMADAQNAYCAVQEEAAGTPREQAQVDYWSTPEALEQLQQKAALQRVITQHRAYVASQLGLEGRRKEQERREAFVCAGVVAMAETGDAAPDAWTWEEVQIGRNVATDADAKTLNVRDVSWAVDRVFAAVRDLTMGDAAARIAPFRGQPAASE